jgi:hypothetical protein
VRRLEVQVAHVRPVDAAGAATDALQVMARNLDAKAIEIVGCAVVLPLGLRIRSAPPRLAYPFLLEPGAHCSDRFDCRAIARLAREAGYSGRVELVALFLEVGDFNESLLGRVGRLPAPLASAVGIDHRSGPFAFDIDRWSRSDRGLGRDVDYGIGG